MERFLSHSVVETENIGAYFAKIYEKTPVVIALYGDLGAGKTAFARGFTEYFISNVNTHSPTYTVVNEYSDGKVNVFHFDMYRISDEDELYAIGFDDYIGRGYCLIEWAENIEKALPSDTVRIKISKSDDENGRVITVI